MEEKDYRMSFFKPTTAFSRTNRNLVLTLVIIWAIAIFGFQILLRVVEKPTPEPALAVFEKAWSNIEKGSPTLDDKTNFASSVLAVLGKSTILSAPEKRNVLTNALNWVVYDLTPEDQRDGLLTTISDFSKIKEKLSSLKDETYINGKKNIISRVAPVLNLKEYSLRAKLLPFVLKADEMKEFTKVNKEKISDVMKLYLIHNRSFLTDTEFLGFPFHYFYTAIFLLILFVVLCWVYAFIIDRLHTKMGTFDKKPVE